MLKKHLSMIASVGGQSETSAKTGEKNKIKDKKKELSDISGVYLGMHVCIIFPLIK